jgi:diadenosine tetraphosphate (Ap4A) HIT family hydrolase
LKSDITRTDPMVVAFNIGMNAGRAAGQTIFHCHIHLIPRREGDVENPRGGVRHVIPGKGFY